MKLLRVISPTHFDVEGDVSRRNPTPTIYIVDIEKERCTCINWIMETARLRPSETEDYIPTYACKHINFVLDLFLMKIK